MKLVVALIYLPVVSKSVHRVKDFLRCEEHGNALAYLGRALSVAEFNDAAPKIMGPNAVTLYGSQPMARLIELEVAVDLAKQESEPAKPGAGETQELPVTEIPPKTEALIECSVEPIADGFMLVDVSSAESRYMGTSLVWENDAALIAPFATQEAARSACPGTVVADQPTTSVEEAVDADEEDEADSEEAAETPVGAEAPSIVGAKAESSVPPSPEGMQPPVVAAPAPKANAKAAVKAKKEAKAAAKV